MPTDLPSQDPSAPQKAVPRKRTAAAFAPIGSAFIWSSSASPVEVIYLGSCYSGNSSGINISIGESLYNKVSPEAVVCFTDKIGGDTPTEGIPYFHVRFFTLLQGGATLEQARMRAIAAIREKYGKTYYADTCVIYGNANYILPTS